MTNRINKHSIKLQVTQLYPLTKSDFKLFDHTLHVAFEAKRELEEKDGIELITMSQYHTEPIFVDTVTMRDVTNYECFNQCIKVGTRGSYGITVLGQMTYDELFVWAEEYFERQHEPSTRCYFQIEEVKEFPSRGWNRTYGIQHFPYTTDILGAVLKMGKKATADLRQYLVCLQVHKYLGVSEDSFNPQETLQTLLGTVKKLSGNEKIEACKNGVISTFGLYRDLKTFDDVTTSESRKPCVQVATVATSNMKLFSIKDIEEVVSWLQTIMKSEVGSTWGIKMEIIAGEEGIPLPEAQWFGRTKDTYSPELIGEILKF